MKTVEDSCKAKHEQMLWVTVRIKSEDAWGSGTIIYSGLTDPAKPELGYSTYVVTCHHVIATNIHIDEKFDPRVGYDIKKETRTPAEVELFQYDRLSICQGVARSEKADILAYDVDGDIALLKLRGNRKVDFVANLFPKGSIDEIHIFDDVWACGAALAHEPIATSGIINFMNELMEEGVDYWMSNAQIIYGNSGGSVYRYSDIRDKFEFIGIPARVAISVAGFSQSPITHMGFFVPITRVYKLLDENFFQFIYDKEFNQIQCDGLRKSYKERNEKLLLAKFGGKPKEDLDIVSKLRPRRDD